MIYSPKRRMKWYSGSIETFYATRHDRVFSPPREGIEYVPCIQQYVSIVPPGTPSTIQSIGSPIYCFWPENIDAAIKIITDAL